MSAVGFDESPTLSSWFVLRFRPSVMFSFQGYWSVKIDFQRILWNLTSVIWKKQIPLLFWGGITLEQFPPLHSYFLSHICNLYTFIAPLLRMLWCSITLPHIVFEVGVFYNTLTWITSTVATKIAFLHSLVFSTNQKKCQKLDSYKTIPNLVS